MKEVSWSSSSGAARANPAIGLLLLGAVVAIVVTLLDREAGSERDTRTGARYREQARAACSIDPGLVTWEEVVTPIAVPIDFPVAIAVGPGDSIHVAGERLVVWKGERSIPLRSAPLPEEYRAVAMDRDGRAFAAASGSVDRIDVGEAEVTVVPCFAVPRIEVGLTSIALNAEGIFVADAVGRRVLRFDREKNGNGGELVAFAEGFNVPSTMDLTVTPEGELVTVDPGRHQVQVRDAYGDVVRSFGENGNRIDQFHGCCNPIAIAVLSDGRWVTAEKGLGVTRVKVYSADGELESVVAGPDQFDEPASGPPIRLDLAVDSKDRILVLDPVRKQVRTFTPKEESK